MNPPFVLKRHRALLLLCVALLSGCGSLSVMQRNQLAAAALAVGAARTPSSEMSQTYYLGVFDPQDQIPPMLYRIRVTGQSGMLNDVNFASGWVPAAVIDSLSGSVSLDSSNGGANAGRVSLVTPKPEETAMLGAGRRLIMFGPEGFREAPRDHRLAIVMGSSPEAFFQAVDEALGTVALAKNPTSFKKLDVNIAKLLTQLKSETNLYGQLGSNP